MSRTKQKKCRLVRIEPDVAKDVAVESKRNGRTVQGEVNSVLRDHYASKWDTPLADESRPPRFTMFMPNSQAAKMVDDAKMRIARTTFVEPAKNVRTVNLNKP